MSSNLRQKLLNIQIELKAPKSQLNKFGDFNYRSCEDVLEAIKPLCKKHNVILMLSDEIVSRGDRFYIKATVVLGDATAGIEDKCIAVTAFAREQLSQKGMQEPQISGSCSSYARKYALGGLFLLDNTDSKDIDAQDNRNSKVENPEAEKPELKDLGPIKTTIGAVDKIVKTARDSGKKYTVYHISGENDKTYKTMDKNLAQLANDAMEGGIAVFITLKADKWGDNIDKDGIELIDG